MTPREVKWWIARFEQELFPHQESEFEQESFTPQGRRRMARVIRELAKAVSAQAGKGE